MLKKLVKILAIIIVIVIIVVICYFTAGLGAAPLSAAAGTTSAATFGISAAGLTIFGSTLGWMTVVKFVLSLGMMFYAIHQNSKPAEESSTEVTTYNSLNYGASGLQTGDSAIISAGDVEQDDGGLSVFNGTTGSRSSDLSQAYIEEREAYRETRRHYIAIIVAGALAFLILATG